MKNIKCAAMMKIAIIALVSTVLTTGVVWATCTCTSGGITGGHSNTEYAAGYCSVFVQGGTAGNWTVTDLTTSTQVATAAFGVSNNGWRVDAPDLSCSGISPSVRS